ncbi:hypothetical protein NHQ30_007281 [Ciborinia camelliae]|nr:hypothetical protein NHQ30_007281 [Ciborinia camelliae]
MCQSTHTYYSCSHWGQRRISDPCQWAINNSVKHGCFNTTDPEGVDVFDYSCPSCKYRETCGITSTSITHVDMNNNLRPLTRESIEKSRKEAKAFEEQTGELKTKLEEQFADLSKAVSSILETKRKMVSRLPSNERKDRFEQELKNMQDEHEERLKRLKEEISWRIDDMESEEMEIDLRDREKGG